MGLTIREKREIVKELSLNYPKRAIFEAIGLPKSSFYYCSQKRDETQLRRAHIS